MEFLEYQRLNQAKFEKIILFIYTVYSMGMTAVAVNNGWNTWYVLGMNIGVILSWVVYAGHYWNYRVRALFTACVMQLTVVMYMVQMPNLMAALSTFIAMVILLGLYGVPEIIYVPAVTSTFLLLYHGHYLGKYHSGSIKDDLPLILQIASLYFVEYMVHNLVKKQMESNEQLLKTIVELQEAEISKDDFLANVSHEIRTPINTICGMSEVMLREKLPDDVRDNIMQVQTAGRNLMAAVGDILDFSELQSDKVEVVEEVYNITSTVNDVINLTLARMSGKNIELIIDCQSDIPCGLIGDEQKIRRVIMNIVSNAVKFTEKGGVGIYIEFRETGYGGNLCIRVTDTGIGIKEETMEKLFSEFGQADARRNRKDGGLGLGLAISQAIVNKMGGFITIHSEPGKGSQIQFVVPQKVENEGPIAEVIYREQTKVAAYINMEQFELLEIRDEYANNMVRMFTQLDVPFHMCRNFAELTRRIERENFTHIFISMFEYQEEKAYFDDLSLHTKLIIIIDKQQESELDNPHLLRIYKPFYIMPIVRLLNGELPQTTNISNPYHKDKFIAPDAHILVVDDNMMNIKVLEGLLKPYQIRVTKALSGQEALSKIDSMDYDFVFMDHMMPEMDGIEALHRIRQKGGSYFENVPILALTANAVAGMREMFISEGFYDFVAKPVESSVLERVLRRTLPSNKLLPVTAVHEPPAPEVTSMGMEEQMDFGDLDVAAGVTYCGNMENYIEVLRMHCVDGAENKAKIEDFFGRKDWKNYTILVHALKSSMKSIGALPLSEMAKALEMAGKEDRADYIMENHHPMIDEYDRILKMLRENRQINPDGAEEDNVEGMPVLSDSDFEKLLKDFEDAVFTLKAENVQRVLDEMQQYSYRQHSLKKLLEPLNEKVEMCDFMSAYEAVCHIEESLKEQ